MRRLTYFISLSIDGFIAGPNDEVDFFHGSDDYMQWMTTQYADALPSHARETLGLADRPLTRFDTVLMGRRTYDPALALGITSPYAHLEQFVFSRTLSSSDDRLTVLEDEPARVVSRLKEDDGLDIYLAGGGSLAGQLLEEIDQLVIKRYPVVAGSGLHAFGPRFVPTPFALTDVQAFSGGNIVEVYERPNSSTA